MQYGYGDIIEQNAFGDIRRVVIDRRISDIKNGRPGFEGRLGNGEEVWGYDYQILRMIGKQA